MFLWEDKNSKHRINMQPLHSFWLCYQFLPVSQSALLFHLSSLPHPSLPFLPDDPTQFWDQDRHYFSRLESSRWLSHVSKCLEVAQSAAAAIFHQNSSVILQGEAFVSCYFNYYHHHHPFCIILFQIIMLDVFFFTLRCL